ncbi:hypothetical protein C8R43DRAFT_612137 [Mycena crocata]|nr:hypothetical protein C8R43DRAFT_612137 [Mycena crocata]
MYLTRVVTFQQTPSSRGFLTPFCSRLESRLRTGSSRRGASYRRDLCGCHLLIAGLVPRSCVLSFVNCRLFWRSRSFSSPICKFVVRRVYRYTYSTSRSAHPQLHKELCLALFISSASLPSCLCTPYRFLGSSRPFQLESGAPLKTEDLTAYAAIES